MGYDSKGILMFNLKYEHAISFINFVKFINYYQMPRSISSKLFVIASGGGEANVYGSSSFKQVACLILQQWKTGAWVKLTSYVPWLVPRLKEQINTNLSPWNFYLGDVITIKFLIFFIFNLYK